MRRGSVASSSWPSSADAPKPALDCPAVRSKRRAQSAVLARASEAAPRARARGRRRRTRGHRPQLQRAAVRDRAARGRAHARVQRRGRLAVGLGRVRDRAREQPVGVRALHWAGRVAAPRRRGERPGRHRRRARPRRRAERARVDLDARARGVRGLDRVETERVHLIQNQALSRASRRRVDRRRPHSSGRAARRPWRSRRRRPARRCSSSTRSRPSPSRSFAMCARARSTRRCVLAADGARRAAALAPTHPRARSLAAGVRRAQGERVDGRRDTKGGRRFGTVANERERPAAPAASSRRRRSTASPVSRSVARSEISRRISSTWSRASCCRSEARGSTARPWRLGTRKPTGHVQCNGAWLILSRVGERGAASLEWRARALSRRRENRSIVCLLTAFATAI